MDERISWYIRNRIDNVPIENFWVRESDRLDYTYVQKNLSVNDLINSNVSKFEAYQKIKNADTPGAWTIYQMRQAHPIENIGDVLYQKCDNKYNFIYECLNEKIYEVPFYTEENLWINDGNIYNYFLDMIENILSKYSLYYNNIVFTN